MGDETRRTPGRTEHAVTADGAEAHPRTNLLRRHPYLVVSGVAVLVVVLIAGTLWWLHARQYESTDDAFIDSRPVAISAQINGAIVDVPVTDNERVEAGAVLVEIDDRDYRAALDQARAQVEQGEANITNVDAQIDAQNARIDQARRQVVQAQAALQYAQEQDARAQKLLAAQAGTQQAAQQAHSDLVQNEANLAAAQANLAASERQIAVLKAQRTAAMGQLDAARASARQAEINLSRTVITAPVTGRATKITAAKGAYAQIGQAQMMFVPEAVWVTANFKETQLADMRPGQPVEVSVDAYPGRTFPARVDSIQAGSGAAFSLLPPENATGNYVKVVQRVPVKIVFDQRPEVYLGPGMSVVPQVKVR